MLDAIVPRAHALAPVMALGGLDKIRALQWQKSPLYYLNPNVNGSVLVRKVD